jgi:hypothetical protein
VIGENRFSRMTRVGHESFPSSGSLLAVRVAVPLNLKLGTWYVPALASESVPIREIRVTPAQKSSLKRDGPVFFSSAPVKVAGDERTIMAIVAPHRGETNHPANTSSGRAVLLRCLN